MNGVIQPDGQPRNRRDNTRQKGAPKDGESRFIEDGRANEHIYAKGTIMATQTKTTGRAAVGTFSVTRADLKRLPMLGRDALKAVHLAVTGDKVFGLRDDILERTQEAVREHLGLGD